MQTAKITKDRMLDLKQLTTDVCRIATEVGHFLKEERKNFHRERVVEKHAHDYVSYVDKELEAHWVIDAWMEAFLGKWDYSVAALIV